MAYLTYGSGEMTGNCQYPRPRGISDVPILTIGIIKGNNGT